MDCHGAKRRLAMTMKGLDFKLRHHRLGFGLGSRRDAGHDALRDAGRDAVRDVGLIPGNAAMPLLPNVPKGGVLPMSRRVMNLSHLLRQCARRHPDGIGLAHGAARWTWAQLDRQTDAAAAGLAGLGIGKGDRVLVQSRNCREMVEAMFACFRLGAVYVPANFRQTPEEVADLCRTSGASAMVCGAGFPAHAAAVRAAAPGLLVLSIGTAGGTAGGAAGSAAGRSAASTAASTAGGAAGGTPGFGASWDDLLARHDGQVLGDAAVEHDDPCWFFFTSGTTGRPKAAVLTHGQMAFVVNNHLADLMPGMTADDASLVLAPLSHGAGVHLLVQVARGVKSILPEGERLDPEAAWRLVAEWRVTNMFTVPTIVKLLTEHPAVDRHDHSSLRQVIYAGAPMYREDQKFALRKLGPVLVQYFGLGEVTGAITVLPAALHGDGTGGWTDARTGTGAGDGTEARAGTCGWERTGMQVSIQDDAGRELPPFGTGEICVCGPAVFAGYYDNPDANAKAFRGGWFRTGDLGHLDPQGFLFITGRASDMYISGGSNVYPREIEEKLLEHPAIAEVAVLGMPDPVWGEAGVAVCVLREGAALTEGDLLAWLVPKVTRYKLPRQVAFWDALPRSAYGKVTKKLIRAELEARSAPGGPR